MPSLDNLKEIEELNTDRLAVAESNELLPDQLRQVLDEARLIKMPHEYSRVTQVVVNGMGGSNIGVGVVKSAFGDRIKVPVSIVPGYSVPAHVDKNTLYIISSYSGTTEEPLGVYREVQKRGARIAAITMDGKKSKLAKLMLKDNIPGYMFKPSYNPSGQPRLGLGYTLFGIAVILAKAGLFKIDVREMEDVIASMEIWGRELKPESPARLNPAKKLAAEVFGKIPVLVGAEHTAGNIRVLRNQINECSKNFAACLTLPDLNHHAMEGLAFPAANKTNLMFMFFDSELYHPRIRKRSRLTKEVVRKNGIATASHTLKAPTKLAQAFELLQLGVWISYYLGVLNKVDPEKIPWVDWFKEQLK
jgi:glucose/mannose-6-phosphate isomerase